MKENRMLREQQYAERRAQDWEQTLRRELELHASMRQQYQTQTASEMTAWEEAQRARAAAKAAKHQAMCEKMAWQLVGLAERAAEYREKTGQLVPRNEWRRWLAMFVANDPELAPPEPQPTEVSSVCMHACMHAQTETHTHTHTHTLMHQHMVSQQSKFLQACIDMSACVFCLCMSVCVCV